jgi:hypothetical protein
LLLATCYLLLATCYLLLATCYLLLVRAEPKAKAKANAFTAIVVS